MSKSYRHKAEVIEIYDNGLRAAVKFYCNIKRGERIECVNNDGTSPNGTRIDFSIGQKGTIDYGRIIGGYGWTFEPFKD